MKLLLFILGLTCHYIVSAQLGGWTLVTPQAYQADPNIKNLLEWGVNDFTAQEIAAGHLPAGTYTSQTITTIYSQVVNGVNYQYDTTVSNNLGWLLRATFVVNNVPATNTTSLVSYVYEILNNPLASIAEEEFILFEEENLGGFSPVAISQLSTDTSLNDALNFGVQNVTAQAVADHRLPASEYEVIEVHSISEQVVAGLNDHFDVSVQNCAGLIARIAFTVFSPPGSTDAANGMQATLNSLGVTGIPIGGLIGGNCAGFNEEMNLEAALGEVDLSSAASAASSARLLQNGLPGGWSVVPLSEARSDMDLQHALAFGVKQVTQMGIKSGQLPNQRYSSRLLSAQEQVVSGMNYKFVVALNGNRGARHRVMMEVYSQPWTGTLQLVSSMIM